MVCPMRTSWSDDRLRCASVTVDDIQDFAGMLAKDTVCEHVVFGPNSPDETVGFFEPLIVPMQESLGHGKRPANHGFILRDATDGRFVGPRRRLFARVAHHDRLLHGPLREDVTVDLDALAERYR
jgi:hypothetical protein